MEELLREAETQKMLEHPGILPLLTVGKQPFGVDQQEEWLYLVTKYASGGSLDERLKQQPLPLQEALTILWQIGQALSYAHERPEGAIVHRDLKPSNILFDVRGDPMVADFGLATVLPDGHTRTVDPGGTPPYMAPEQFDKQASVKSDQYALALIAYKMLTGRHPFPGGTGLQWWAQHKMMIPDDPARYNPALPASTCQAILRALAKDPHDRYDTILQFVIALRGAAARRTYIEWFREGVHFYDTGNFSAALAAYKETRLLQPSLAEAHFNEGMALHRLRQYEAASVALQQAIACDAYTLKFYVQAGITFSHRGLFEQAATMYKKAVSLNAQHTRAWEGLGEAYTELKRFQEAIEAYKQALGLDITRPLQRLNGPIKSDPQKACLYQQLGRILKSTQKNDEALIADECAHTLNPHP